MREAISGDRCPLVATSIDEGGNQWRSVPTRGYFDAVASDLRPVQRDRRHRASDSRSRTTYVPDVIVTIVIRGHQRPSEAMRTRGYRSRWSSEVISGHQRSSEVIRGHQWSSAYQTLSVTMVRRPPGFSAAAAAVKRLGVSMCAASGARLLAAAAAAAADDDDDDEPLRLAPPPPPPPALAAARDPAAGVGAAAAAAAAACCGGSGWLT